MNEIISHIHLRSHDKQFDVNALIYSLQISHTYLQERTHKDFGLCPRELIESVRLDNVLKHLEHEIHFVNLSERCGFGSFKTFRNAFEKRVGISAAQARKQLREIDDKDALKHQWRLKIGLRGGGACLSDFSP